MGGLDDPSAADEAGARCPQASIVAHDGNNATTMAMLPSEAFICERNSEPDRFSAILRPT